MMRPLFLERGWRVRRVAGTVLSVVASAVAVVAGFYAIKILVGLARIVSQVCP